MAPKSLHCVFIYNNRLYAYNTPIHPVLPADLSYIQSMLLTNDRKIVMGAEVDFCCPQPDGGAVSPKIPAVIHVQGRAHSLNEGSAVFCFVFLSLHCMKQE